MARPSILNEEMLEKAGEYLKHRMDNVELTEKGALAFVEVQLPSVVDLALYLGVNKGTIYDWVNTESPRYNEEFSDIVKDVLAEQEKRLINNGLGGMYAPKVVGMILSKHGYSEKQEIDHTSKGESISSNTVVSELTKQLNELQRKTGGGGDGGTSGALDSQTQNKE